VRVALTFEQCWHRVPGGTAVAAIEVARALGRIPGVSPVGVSARHLRPAPPAFTPPVTCRQLPFERHVLYELWHQLGRARVERAVGPVDVIHATGVAVPPRTAPVVYTVHDLAFLRNRSGFTRVGMRFFLAALAAAMDRADVVLCSSRATAEDCERAGFDPLRLRVVPLGVDAAPASVEEIAAARRRHGLDRPYVLWTGTVEPRKNLPTLVEAFRRLGRRDHDLVLVGPEGWNTDLAQIIEPVNESTHVVGFVPAAERNALMAGAAAFCFPSLSEGFGLPVLEAMAQSAPVVTSAGTATEEVAGEAALVVDPTRPDALAEALDAVLSDSALAARLRAAGPARAAQFTWARTAQATVAAYREASA